MIAWIDDPRRSCLLALCVAFGVFLLSFVNHTTLDRPQAAAMAVAVSLPICAIPLWPRVAVAASLLGSVLAPLWIVTPGSIELAAVVVLGGAAARGALPTWLLAFLGTISLGVALTEPLTDDGRLEWTAHDSAWGFLYGAAFACLSVGMGHLIAVTRVQAEALLAQERERRDSALQAERQRIARELHDVAAHHLVAAVVRTKTVERTGDERALREATSFVGRAAEESLRAMRQIVGMLRRPEDGLEPPQPRLSDLSTIFESARGAHLEVNATIAPHLDERVDRATELVIVRILQESIANAIQHSASARIDVDVALEGDELSITVDDAGPAKRAPAEDRRTPAHGVVGMRERARALGGNLTTGVSPLGGWRVAARLPVPACRHAATT